MSNSTNGNGPLRATLEEYGDGSRGWMGRLTVLGAGNDPFRTDTKTGHANGAWLAEHIGAFGLGGKTIHLRGVHYALLGTTKPDGTTYVNDDPTWTWLQGTAGKQARWLGYVGFDQIHDERNAPPVVRIHTDEEAEAYLSIGLDIEIPDVEDIVPAVGIEGFMARQEFKYVLIGEKSSLEPVLGPLSASYGADLYLPTGEMSDTLIHMIAKSITEDGRRTLVFYFADCDPSGYQMPISVARKLQAFKAGFFPEIEFEVHRVALTPDHVRDYGLPETPLKDTERRADRWEELMGVKQTEIDALATLQPNLLRKIARQAIDPFFDKTLEKRVKEERDAWLAKAQVSLEEQIGAGHIEAIGAEAEERLEELREKVEQIEDSLRLGIPDDIEFPTIGIPGPTTTAEQANARGLPLIDSDWDWAEQTERLVAAKAYADA